MEEQEILLQITKIFCTILKRNDINLTLGTRAADVDGWDSLTHMILIEKVEKHFAIKFQLKEVMKFKIVGDMVDCIKIKLKNKS
jgi:acyl carrier protein